MKAKIFSILVAVTWILILAGCSLWEDKTLPEGVYGIWETDNPRYKEAYLEITKAHIAFHTIEGDANLNRITNIETESEPESAPEHTLIHISYEDRDGLEYLLSFYYSETSDGPVIRFKNQKEMDWTKRKDS